MQQKKIEHLEGKALEPDELKKILGGTGGGDDDDDLPKIPPIDENEDSVMIW